FRRNPAGQRIWVATVGDEVVAQYAGLPARVWIAGRESCFTQIVDSMVHPEHRKGLKRPGLFVHVGRQFLDSVGGPDKDLVCWGMPIEPAWRIGQAHFGSRASHRANIS
ncbi:MAG: GNAT family N-acetyltransferase, partial [Phycisphaeraceae bacterium]|nr:GNAT family N-acetyltransferase [Phycisphaeraceae bacterium]